MPEDVRRKPPLPVNLAFVACREIYQDPRTGTTILVGPVTQVPANQFPVHVRLSMWAEFTGGHGTYQPRLCLLDATEEVVWGYTPPEPLLHTDPLQPCRISFYDLPVAVPHAGRYRLVLLLNGEELAQRPMWFGPAAFAG